MAKSTISMAIFNSYVKLPEGMCMYVYDCLCKYTWRPVHTYDFDHWSLLPARDVLLLLMKAMAPTTQLHQAIHEHKMIVGLGSSQLLETVWINVGAGLAPSC